MLKKIESRYVTKFYGSGANPGSHQYYLLLEYCNSDLHKLMSRRKVLPEKEAAKIIWHIFHAQHDLSLHQIIHRYLKPGNIGLHFDGLDSQQAKDEDFLKKFDFVSNDGSYHIKFFDLGFSDLADKNGFGSNSTSGTPLYSSPEQL